MRYLVVSATSLEIAPLSRAWNLSNLREGVVQHVGDLSVLVTGVGMMHTAFHLGRILETGSFDHVIQAGIAGAFHRELELAEVVEVISQQTADLGFPTQNGFNDIFDMGLISPDSEPYRNGRLSNISKQNDMHPGLPKVSGVSVNSISSDEGTISAIISKYQPDVEVMEGVALHYACLKKGLEYSEIRAVSNYVEPRNKSEWKIEEAVGALNTYLMDWLKR